MLNESLKNVLTKDVTEQIRAAEPAKHSRKAESGRRKAEDSATEFADEVERIIRADERRTAESSRTAGTEQPADIQKPSRQKGQAPAAAKKITGAESRAAAVKNRNIGNNNEIRKHIAVIEPAAKEFKASESGELYAAQYVPVNAVPAEPLVNAVYKPIEGAALEVRNSQASELISSALAKISSKLTLPSAVSFDEQSLIRFDQDTLEQFAEILHALDSIGNLLDKVAVRGEGLDVDGMNISADDAAMLSADLRVEKFHIQMGLSMIGAREIVSDIMNDKYDAPITAFGISQAADPASLGMSAIDTARVFGSLAEEGLTAAIERIKLAKSGQAENAAAQNTQAELPAADAEEMLTAFKAAAAAPKAAPEQISVNNVKAENVKVDNVKAENVNANNVKAENININDVKPEQVKVDNVEPESVKADNVNTNSVKPEQAKAENVNVNNVKPENVNASEAKVDNAKAEQVKTANVSPEQVKADNVEPESVKAENINASVNNVKPEQVNPEDVKVDNTVKAEQVKTVNVNPEQVKADNAEPESVKADNANTNNVKPEQANAEDVKFEQVKAENIKAQDVKAENVKTENVEVDNAVKTDNVNNVKPEQVKPEQVNPEYVRAASNVKPQSVSGKNEKSEETKSVKTEAVSAKSETARALGGIELPLSVSELAAANTNRREASSAPSEENHAAFFAGVSVANEEAAESVKSEKSAFTLGGALQQNTAEAAESEGVEPADIVQADVAQAKAQAAVEHVEKASNAFSRVDNEAIIRQITEKMHHAIRNGVQEVRMVMRPEALGEVRMSLRVEGDVVFARIQVENSQVKAIVESQLQNLKDSLEQQNLQAGAFSVDVGSDTDRSPREAWQELAEASRKSKFREGGVEHIGASEADMAGVAAGSDTGRRFGNNTFELFI